MEFVENRRSTGLKIFHSSPKIDNQTFRSKLDSIHTEFRNLFADQVEENCRDKRRTEETNDKNPKFLSKLKFEILKFVCFFIFRIPSNRFYLGNVVHWAEIRDSTIRDCVHLKSIRLYKTLKKRIEFSFLFHFVYRSFFHFDAK